MLVLKSQHSLVCSPQQYPVMGVCKFVLLPRPKGELRDYGERKLFHPEREGVELPADCAHAQLCMGHAVSRLYPKSSVLKKRC